MPTLRPLPLALFVLLTLVFPAGAWTSRTPEGSALGNIGSFTKFFESEKKRLPESWKELEEAWGKPFDEVFPHVLPTRRYAFYSPPLILKIHEKRSMQVVAITRKPMWETTRKGNMGRTIALKGPGRYVLLHRDQKDGFFIEWFDEPTIQRLWPSTGQALPIPDNEPEREWVKKARTRILAKRIAIGALVLLAVAWISKRFFAKQRSGPIPS